MAGKHTVSDNERANAATLNPIFEGFHYRIADLEKAGSALKQARDEIVALGLERINEVVTPALQAIENVADLSDLFRARSETTVEIGTGVTEFIIVPEDRVQFAPPLFVSISVDGQLDKWVVGQVQSWTEATGQLFVNITHVKGSGTFADWVVSPANTPDTGPTLDAYSKAEVDAAILAAVAQAKSELLGGAPAAALDTIAELADALGNDDDFATWVTAQLAAKSDIGHGHAIADVTGLQTALDGKASLSSVTAKADSSQLASTSEGDGASRIGYDNSTSGLTAANTQAAIDELTELHSTCAFRAKRTSDQSVANNTLTRVQLNVEDYDIDGTFDSSVNYRHTPTKAGKYLYIAMLTLDGLADQKELTGAIAKNGSTYRLSRCFPSRISVPTTEIAAIIEMNGTTDYIELNVYHDHGSSRDLVVQNDSSVSLTGIYLGDW